MTDAPTTNSSLADTLHDRGEPLKEAIETVRECYCNRLEGHFPEDWNHPAYKDCVAKLDTAWREFREAVGEAERVEGRPG